MKRTYHITIVMLLVITQSITAAHHTQTPLPKVKFENTILKLIDGIPFCMDGDNIKKLVILTALFKHMLYGTDPKTKTYAPRYTFKGHKLSIAELTMTEQTESNQADLQQALDEALVDLYEQVHPFLEEAKNALEYNLPLVEEWMEKTNRMDTELYDIHTAEQSGDFSHIQQHVTSFEKLSILLEDLISYFESLIHSCPKGVAQFKDIMRKRHAQT